jgi:putative ABC transport system ATP-binding protein
VTRSYRLGERDFQVLKGVDMASTGEIVALQGPASRANPRSSIIHLLGLLDRPTSGRYELHGRDVSHLTDDEQSELRNRTLGFVFQSFYLVPYITALDNVLLPGLYSPTPAHQLKERARALLDQVGLADRAGHQAEPALRRPCSSACPGPWLINDRATS